MRTNRTTKNHKEHHPNGEESVGKHLQKPNKGKQTEAILDKEEVNIGLEVNRAI